MGGLTGSPTGTARQLLAVPEVLIKRSPSCVAGGVFTGAHGKRKGPPEHARLDARAQTASRKDLSETSSQVPLPLAGRGQGWGFFVCTKNTPTLAPLRLSKR